MNDAAPPRRIWLCADDYGLAEGVNRAIRDLISRGRLNATSVMVVGPAIGRAEVTALQEVAAKSPLAVANAKSVVHQLWSDNGSVDAGLRFELERDAFYCLTSHDAPEGLAAFSEKREPNWRGR